MPRPSVIDYAALCSYDAKRGLYYKYKSINGIRRRFSAKDPEAVFRKISEALDPVEEIPDFRRAAEAWQEAKWPTIKAKTQLSYDSALARAIEALGPRKIDGIHASDIDRLLLQMKEEGYSAKTVKTQKSVLRMIFNFAIVHDPPWITANPCVAVTIPRGLPRTKRSSPGDEIMRTIIRSVDAARFGLFPFLLLYTGCRRGEALALTWADIDLDAMEINIDKEYVFLNGSAVLQTPKTEAGVRKIPLLPALAAKLEKPPRARPGDLIFHTQGGKPLYEAAFRRSWKRYCIDTGFIIDEPEERVSRTGRRYIYHNIKPTLTAHELRHGYATLLYEAEIDVKAAQSFLGHADIHTTQQIYTDLRDRKRHADAHKLTNYMRTLEG